LLVGLICKEIVTCLGLQLPQLLFWYHPPESKTVPEVEDIHRLSFCHSWDTISLQTPWSQSLYTPGKSKQSFYTQKSVVYKLRRRNTRVYKPRTGVYKLLWVYRLAVTPPP